MVACGELGGNGVVFLDQGTPRHLGRMRSQDQLDFQLSHLARNGLLVDVLCLEPFQQLTQHAVLEGRQLIGPTAPHAMMLLGDIGQVEKMIEGAGHGQQLVVAQPAEGLLQLSGSISRAESRGLGALANSLDLLEENLAVLRADGVAQQLAEKMNILAQSRIDYRHEPSPITASLNWQPLCNGHERSMGEIWTRVPSASAEDKFRPFLWRNDCAPEASQKHIPPIRTPFRGPEREAALSESSGKQALETGHENQHPRTIPAAQTGSRCIGWNSAGWLRRQSAHRTVCCNRVGRTQRSERRRNRICSGGDAYRSGKMEAG